MQSKGRSRNLHLEVLNIVRNSFPRPVSTREISIKLNIAWHTADRYCLKLKFDQKIDSFIIGKSTAWYLKDYLTELKKSKKTKKNHKTTTK